MYIILCIYVMLCNRHDFGWSDPKLNPERVNELPIRSAAPRSNRFSQNRCHGDYSSQDFKLFKDGKMIGFFCRHIIDGVVLDAFTAVVNDPVAPRYRPVFAVFSRFGRIFVVDFVSWVELQFTFNVVGFLDSVDELKHVAMGVFSIWIITDHFIERLQVFDQCRGHMVVAQSWAFRLGWAGLVAGCPCVKISRYELEVASRPFRIVI